MTFFDESMGADVSMVPAGMRMPLSRGEQGHEYTVVKISGRDTTRKHLADLGLSEGSKVTIVNHVDRNLILDLKGSRVGIGVDLAERVTVVS